MPPIRLLLCGQSPLLLHQLRTAAGSWAQISQAADVPRTAQPPRPDLVVVVHQPPQQDGLRTLRQWKQLEPGLPVIVVTTDYSGPATRLLFVSGALDVLELPVSNEKLLSCLEAFGARPATPAEPEPETVRLVPERPAVEPIAGAISAVPALEAVSRPAPGSAVWGPFEEVPEPDRPGVQISYFGEFSIRLEGRPVQLPNQAKLLLAYLMYHHPRALAREHLAKVFWPDKYETAPDSARRGLNVEITRIRNLLRALGREDRDYIVFKNNCYRLDDQLPWKSDLMAFRELFRQVQDFQRQGLDVPGPIYQQALQQFTGTFLDDFPETSCNWVDIERHRLGADFERIADQYSEQLCRQGDYWKAISVCNELIARDMRMEVIHRRLMECYRRVGSWPKVQQQYELCSQMMDREFQCKPSTETIRLFEEIRGEMNS